MTDVIQRLAEAMNQHDLDGPLVWFTRITAASSPRTPVVHSSAEPRCGANWEAMFAGIPDFRAEVSRSVQDGDTTWTEWRWWGTRTDGQQVDVRGVTLFEIHGGLITAGRLYMEDVEDVTTGIDEAVRSRSGHMPRRANE